MRTIVFYHSPCYSMDGYVAAWIAHKHFGENARYVGINKSSNYGDKFPGYLCDENQVYMLDFSLQRELMSKTIDRAKSITILDHHKSSISELDGLANQNDDKIIEIDLERSTATMTWNHFFPNSKIPTLVKYVEDRTLWRFFLEHSKIINDWIAAYGEDPRNNWNLWDDMSDDMEHHMEYVLDQARAIQQYKCRAISSILKGAHAVELGGFHGMAVNQSLIAIAPEVAKKLAELADFGACYFRLRDGRWKVSLRSRGRLDVAAIAEQYGGSGRTNAAGFVSDKPLPVARRESVCASK